MTIVAWVYIFAFVFFAGFWLGAWLWWKERIFERDALAEELIHVVYRVTGCSIAQLAEVYRALHLPAPATQRFANEPRRYHR